MTREGKKKLTDRVFKVALITLCALVTAGMTAVYDHSNRLTALEVPAPWLREHVNRMEKILTEVQVDVARLNQKVEDLANAK